MSNEADGLTGTDPGTADEIGAAPAGGSVRPLLALLGRGSTDVYSYDGELVAGGFSNAVAMSRHGRMAVALGQRWGFLDADDGTMVIAPDLDHHDSPLTFNEGVAAVGRDGAMALIDPSGATVATVACDPPDGQVPYRMVAGRMGVQTGNMWGWVGRDGSPIGRQDYSEIGPLPVLDSEAGPPCAIPGSIARFATSGSPVRWGFVDADGEQVLAPNYEDAFDMTEGLAAVQFGMRWGFVDGAGRVVLTPTWEDAGPFVGNRAMARLGGMWGMIDQAGQWQLAPTVDAAAPPGTFDRLVVFTASVIDPRTTTINPLHGRAGGIFRLRRPLAPRMSEGLVAAADNRTKKWGYLEPNGTWVIKPRFDLAGPFREGRAGVRVGDTDWHFVDVGGALHGGPWVTVERLHHGRARVVDKDGPAWVDGDGRTVVARPRRRGFVGWLRGLFGG